MSEQTQRRYYPLVLAAVVICLFYAFGTKAAVLTEYPSQTALQVGSAGLMIMPGSAQDGLTVADGSLTVSVPAGEVFDLRSPYASRVNLENDSQYNACNLIADSKDNQIFIQGPRVVTVTPGNITCSSAGAEKNIKPSLIPLQPASGASLTAGQAVTVVWQSTGYTVQYVRIRLSLDGGRSYAQTVAESVSNNGMSSWTVPSVVTTGQARLKFYGLDGMGNILAIAVSPGDFHIEGTAPPLPETPASPAYDYDKEAATAAASSIDVDKGFSRPAGTPEPACAGMRIKGSGPAVYFCGADGKRHAFPNQKIHDSWYAGDFAGVVTMTDAELASVPLGASVTYRPGVRLVKIQTDPKVYAVAADGTLRWVPSEAAALALYGADWNKLIDDVPDSFFADYAVGEPIALK